MRDTEIILGKPGPHRDNLPWVCGRHVISPRMPSGTLKNYCVRVTCWGNGSACVSPHPNWVIDTKSPLDFQRPYATTSKPVTDALLI